MMQKHAEKLIQSEQEIKVLIVEDEPLQVLDMKMALQQKGCQVVGDAGDIMQAQKLLLSERPDLILIDIELSNRQPDGIRLAEWIRAKYQLDIAMIFITGSKKTEYLQRALQTLPDAYIRKPYNQEDLYIRVDLALKRLEKQYVFFKDGRAYRKIKLDDILYIESARDYKDIFTPDGKIKVTVRMSMDELLDKLPRDKFLRTGKSHIVNMNHIKLVDKKNIYVGNNKSSVPIGTGSYRDTVFAQLGIVE